MRSDPAFDSPFDLGVVSLGSVDPVTVRAGERAIVEIPVVVASGYHVQANPASSELLIPLELTLAASDGIEIAQPSYPQADIFIIEGTTEELRTYHGHIVVRVAVMAAMSATAGEHLLEGTLRYQACDSRRCFPPTNLPVEITVFVDG